MIEGSFPGEVHKRIEDDWLNKQNDMSGDYSYHGSYVDCRIRHAVQDVVQRPRGIICRSASDGESVALVAGYLWGENESDIDQHPIVPGVVHPLAFQRIYRTGTTARTIKIYG